MVQESAFECNNNVVTLNQQTANTSEIAVAELYALLRETVTCPPGCAGVVWARYHAAVAEHGFAAAITALNRFAEAQTPKGAA